jgi:hypothetical protein
MLRKQVQAKQQLAILQKTVNIKGRWSSGFRSAPYGKYGAL